MPLDSFKVYRRKSFAGEVETHGDNTEESEENQLYNRSGQSDILSLGEFILGIRCGRAYGRDDYSSDQLEK